MARFTTPIPQRIELEDSYGPFWIEVKRDLDTGDAKRFESAGLKSPVEVNGRIISPIDWEIYDIDRVFINLMDWSLTKPDDKGREVPIRVSKDALRALEPETFDIISRAINKHIMERAAEKKAERETRMKATTTPPPPSPSVTEEPTS